MIIPDLNVLLYASDSSSLRNKEAVDWLEEVVNSGTEEIGIPWVVHLGFLRLTTNKKIFPRPLSIEAAAAWLDSLETHPFVKMINPGQAHPGILRHLLLMLGSGGNLVTDAHIASLGLELNATIVTGDRDFQRFPGLKIKLLY